MTDPTGVVVATDEVVTDGVTVRYRVDGPPAAPVLVLAGSLGTSAAVWDAVMPALSTYLRVVRYELRGHGGAPAPPGPYTIADLGGDLVGLLDVLDIERASIAGLSLGGMVAMWVAARHADRVERLVLCCTAASMPPASAWTDRAATVRSAGVASLADGLIGRWFTAGFAERRPDVAAQVRAMLDADDAEGYAACCEALATADQRRAVAGITASTLVLAGAADPVVPPDMALELARAIPGAALTVVAGAAHLAPLEQPERVARALVDHVVGPPVERGDAIRRAVLGDAHVERSAAVGGAFGASFTDFITRYAWGDIWARPGLDLPTRSCVTLAALVAMGRWDELPLHLRGARRNGLTPDQIGEVLLHCAVYAGVPAANTAFAIACRVFDEDADG